MGRNYLMNLKNSNLDLKSSRCEYKSILLKAEQKRGDYQRLPKIQTTDICMCLRVYKCVNKMSLNGFLVSQRKLYHNLPFYGFVVVVFYTFIFLRN